MRWDRTLCRRGHPMTADNVYQRPDGRERECRTCRREAHRHQWLTRGERKTAGERAAERVGIVWPDYDMRPL